MSRPEPDSPVIRFPAACRFLNLSKSCVQKLEAGDPTFPKRLRLAKRASGFFRRDLESWLESRRERDDEQSAE